MSVTAPTLDAPNWQPNVADVALRLKARTRQANGQLAGTFNSSTQPTDVDVTNIVAQAVQLIRPRLGPVPDSLLDSARALAALKAAIMVEESYFPEQVDTAMSPLRYLVADYLSSLEAWDTAARGEEPGGIKVASMPVGTLYPGYATGTY